MARLETRPVILAGEGWADYGLIDSGHGRKLERYGPHRFIRPEPQALWTPRAERWASDGEFVPGSDEDGGGRWQFANPVPQDGWPLARGDVRFTAQCTPFRHLGFFPDMAPVWDWMGERLRRPRLDRGPLASSAQGRVQPPAVPGQAGDDGFSTLNLFGYTGVGTLALSQFGPVTHVDASKKSVAQARLNADLSGMATRPVRWIVDDAAKFTAREVRRGKRYDGIILDPPKFGRGPEGEVWRLEDHLGALISDCSKLLDKDSRFLFLTVYAVRMSSLALAGLLDEALVDLPGTIEHGDLAVREEGQIDGKAGRLLPTAIFARWRND
jgi:23S rRNA (cytosine1962-C5)-methyltransferase